MKAKLFVMVAAVIGALLATQALSGCGRGSRTRATPAPKPAPARDPRPPLETDPDKILALLKSSVHAKQDCSDCHAPPKAGAKAGEVGKGQCTACHKAEAAAYAETIHASKFKEGKESNWKKAIVKLKPDNKIEFF